MTTTNPTNPTVDPSNYPISLTETLALPFDPAGYLDGGTQTPDSATSTLTDLLSGVTGPLDANPNIVGSGTTDNPWRIIQIVSGPGDLVRVGSYLLIVNFVASPSGNVWAMELTLNAVP